MQNREQLNKKKKNLPSFSDSSGAVEGSGGAFAERRRSALVMSSFGFASVVVVADGRRQRKSIVIRHLFFCFQEEKLRKQN